MLSLPHIEKSFEAYTLKQYIRCSRLELLPDQRERWHHELRWYFVDGTEATITGDHLSGELLPAAPGFEIIDVEFDLANDCPTIARQPVIGWRVAYDCRYGDGELRPVGPQLDALVQDLRSKPNGVEVSGIRQPDGRVYSLGQWHMNEDAFLNATKSRWLQKKERALLEARHKDCPFCADKRRRQMDDDIPF